MFVCGVPKNKDDLARVLAVELKQFGTLSIPATVAQDIFKIRPEIFMAITGPESTVAAYSIAYPLQRQWSQALIAGDITETDLTPDMLLGRYDSHDDCCVYIASVVIDSQYDLLTKSILMSSLLFWRVQQLRDASVNRLLVTMTGVSKQGERLIRYVGAKQLNDGLTRKDGHAIYGRRITAGFLQRSTAAIERCCNSRVVEMNLNFRPSVYAIPLVQ